MADKISPKLFAALQKKLGLGRSRLYSRISQHSATRRLDRQLAAIDLAAEAGLPISTYASATQIGQLRSGSREATAPAGPATPASNRNPRTARRSTAKRRRAGQIVFVVYGRDEKLRRSMFTFLRAVGLKPLEWQKALALTKKGSPYVGEVLDAAFQKASATIVLLSPDDEARLKPEFLKSSDRSEERELTGQARANVLFEAGMAFGRHQDRTILVQVGFVRPFSDVGGRHVVHLSNDSDSRQAFLNRLSIVGCDVDQTGTDWHREGDFSV